MKLDYNILWFEDDNKSFNDKKIFIKSILDDFYLDFPEPRHEIDGKNIDTIDYSKYDLIIADMNLAKQEKAMSLLDKIRKQNIFTEVLFYSSDGENAVRKELANYNIDGAYCSGRNIEDFEFKAREVIQTIIKKTQDLVNLRGLVMSEVSELDSLMEDIIFKYYSTKTIDSKEWKKFTSKIIKNAQDSLKKRLLPKYEEVEKNGAIEKKALCSRDCIHIWYDTNDITEILKDFEFDSSKKAHTIHEIIKELGCSADFSFSEYNDEIIIVRNDLAHSISEIQDGKEVLVTKKHGTSVFSQDTFLEIRKNIKKYNELFSKLQEQVNAEVS